jgi:hypothetical protein
MTPIDHIRRRIESSEVIAYPFPHLLISEFFPDDLYRQMLAEMPMADGNNGTNYAKEVGGIWKVVRDEIYPEILRALEYKLLDQIDLRNAVFGTQMYPVEKTYEMNVPWNTYPHVPENALGTPVIAPYTHNTAVIWVSTFRAIHGRTVVNAKRSYIYAYRLFWNDVVDFSVIDPARNGPMKIKVIA